MGQNQWQRRTNLDSKDISKSELTEFSNQFDSAGEGKEDSEDDEVSTLSNCANDNTINQRKDDMNKWRPGNIKLFSKGNESYM